MSVVVLVLVVAIQLVWWGHAQDVVTASVQDGARVASAYGGDTARGGTRENDFGRKPVQEMHRSGTSIGEARRINGQRFLIHEGRTKSNAVVFLAAAARPEELDVLALQDLFAHRHVHDCLGLVSNGPF